MATKKKMLQAAAGSATGGAGLDIDEVFSTYLYEGTGSTQTITNGIDLSGEGGLVWIKNRDGGDQHWLVDSERPLNNGLSSNETSTYIGYNSRVTSLRGDGFRLGSQPEVNASNGDDYASWTFRKAPKFFDVVTYTGDGTNNRTLSHNLGCEVGFLAVKRYNGTGNWRNYHRSLGYDYEGYFNHTDQFYSGSTAFGSQNATSTNFYVGSSNNDSGHQYVAYLFAHNDGDGGFGDGSQDIIKCGSYTGTGAANHFIDLGFEPQWVMIKCATLFQPWIIQDSMRSMTDTDYAWLYANTSEAEASGALAGGTSAARPKGFVTNLTGTNMNASGEDYIYMAIRRGPLAVPEDATEVFAPVATGQTNNPQSGFPTDLWWLKSRNGPELHVVMDRMRGTGKYLSSDSTAAEGTNPSNYYRIDNMTGGFSNGGSYSQYIHWMWKRAPGYFDVAAYTGNGTAGRTVSHNLGVAPEMMWVKSRSNAYSWIVYSSYVPNSSTNRLLLEGTSSADSNTNIWWNSTDPASDNFTLGNGLAVNGSGNDYIAYLFASAPGVSKCGSYTGNGSSQTIDCGFTSGARFVLIKKSSAAGSWIVHDTERGIVSGNDPFLLLNSTQAEVSTIDPVDPNSSGFTVNNYGDWNNSGDTYIFYAIA